MSEWSKVLDSKSSVVNSHRGFESHPLCHLQISPCSLQGLFYCPHCRSAYKKSQASKGMSGSLPASFCCLDDLFAVVVTALRANVMRHLRLVALRAGNETGSIELPVGAALIAACLGSLALWYCHLIFTSEVMRSFSEIHAMG